MRISILFIIIIPIVLASCHKQGSLTKKFGIGFNYKRKISGLPLLPENWKLVTDKEGSFQWMPSRNADSLVYYSKVVRVKNNWIYSEGNSIFGRKKYRTVDGAFFEELSISCFFDNKGNVAKWACEYRGPEYKFNDMDIAFSKPVTKNQADSIITKWGLNSIW